MAESNLSIAAAWQRAWEQQASNNPPPTAGQLDTLVSLVDARVKNAYDAALRKLTRQDQTLSNVRNRASGVLTVATLIASLAASLGFLKGGIAFPTWAKWALFSAILVIALLHLLITWPIKRTFGANPEAVLWCGEMPAEGSVRASLVEELIGCAEKNENWITVCSRLFQFQTSALTAEVIIVIVATLRR